MDASSAITKEQFEKRKLWRSYNYYYADEDIDGQSFLELNDQELRTLGQRIGVIKKLHRLKRLGSWEKRIIERINNQRGQALRKHPVTSDDETSTPTRKRGRPKECTLLSRYPALQFSVDDEVAISRSQVKLCTEAVQ